MLYTLDACYKIYPFYESQRILEEKGTICDRLYARDIIRLFAQDFQGMRSLIAVLYESGVCINPLQLIPEDVIELIVREIELGRYLLVRLYDPREEYQLGHQLTQLPSFPSQDPTPAQTTTFITYQLTYSDGTPAANLTCFVTHPDASKQRIRSDSQGRVDLRAIPMGDYTLEVVPPENDEQNQSVSQEVLEDDDGDDNSEEEDDGQEESDVFDEDDEKESLTDDEDVDDSGDDEISEPPRRQILLNGN